MAATAKTKLHRDFASPADWHRQRHKAILGAHPKIRASFGHNPVTAVFVVLLVGAQLAGAAALSEGPWWLVPIAAYFAGAVVIHALGVLIHECAHNLVFKGSTANKALGIVANLPMVFPGAMDFRKNHLLHHKHLGLGKDADFQAPPPRADEWAGQSWWKKMLYLTVGALLFPFKSSDPPPKDGWDTANLLAEIAVIAPFTWVFGLKALVFLLLSGLFAFGWHPTGIRGYGEHFVVRPSQPTNSYYGPMNWVSFNVGYHVEHHDFPAVPWNRLPELNHAAVEFYRPLASHRSWLALLWRFFTKDEYRVGRYVSQTPASAPVADQVPAKAPALGAALASEIHERRSAPELR